MAIDTIDARPDETGVKLNGSEEQVPESEEQKAQEMPQRLEPEQRRRPAGLVRTRPSTENEPVTAALLARLRRRPSTAPLWVAFIASLIWVFASAAISGPTLLSEPGLMSAGSIPQLVTAAMFLAVPILLIWATSYLVWRAQQMRLASETLVHTALRLIRPQDVTAEGLTSIAQTVRQEIAQLVGGIELAAQRASEIEGLVHREIANLERAFGANEERIRNLIVGLDKQRAALQQAGEIVGQETGPVLASLEEHTGRFGAIVDTATTTLASLDRGLKHSSLELSQTVDELSNRTALASSEIGEQASRLDQTSGVLLNDIRAFSENLATQLDQLSTSGAALNKEQTDFVEQVLEIEGRLVEALRTSSGELSAANAEVAGKVEQVTVAFSEQLRQTATAVARQIDESGGEVSRQIEQSGEEMSERLLSVSGELIHNVARTRDEFSSYLDEVSGRMTGKLEDTSAVLFTRVSEATNHLSEHLDQSTARLSDSIDRTTEQMTERLDAASSQLGERYAQTSGEIASRLDATSAEFTARLGQVSGRITDQLARASDEMAGRLGETVTELAERLDTTAVDLTGRLQGTSGEVTGLLTRTSSDVTAQLDGVSGELLGRLQDTYVQLTSGLTDVSARLGLEVDRAATQLNEQFERIDAQATARFQSITVDLAGTLHSAGEQMFVRLETTAVDLGGRFEEIAGGLAERIDLAARELATRSNASSLRIEEAGEKFASHIEKANAFLGERLIEAAKGLDNELEDATLKLSARLESTSGKVAGRLEEASEVVERAVDTFNTGMERVIDNREERLNELLAQLGAKAEDVGAMMAKYIAVAEEALNQAHGRTHDLGRRLAEQASQAAAVLEAEIRRFEETADHQLAAIAKTLRVQHEKVMGSMAEALSASTREFGQTAQEMKATARQVVKDIELARSELNRAILELPEETRANADAMRRVISDQITALSALAEVVKRQSGLLEVSAPIPELLPTKAVLPGKAEGASSKAPERATAGAQKTAGPRSTNGSRQPARAVLHAGPAEEPAGEAATEDSGEALRLNHAGQGNGSGGLVNGEADASGISRRVEKLLTKVNGAARHLVSTLEGKLDEELERRFNAGETHVYTQHLCQARGPNLQQEIETRYGQDQPIRGRVDGFMRTFERLLDKLSEGEDGQAKVDACLASECGKVYLMLAEMTGRLSKSGGQSQQHSPEVRH